jgi:DNA-binding MarR family transcriptional regulator
VTDQEPTGLPEAPGISLGVLMFIPYRHMEQRILAAVVDAGHPITLAQARIFQRIDHPGSRLTSLAESAQLTKQAAGFLVDQLERSGYVERVQDPQDGRARLIRITRRGYDAIAVASAEQATIEAEWARHLGPQASEELRQALERLREITDPFR